MYFFTTKHFSALFKHEIACVISTDVDLTTNAKPVTQLGGPNLSRMFGMVLRIRYLALACQIAK